MLRRASDLGFADALIMTDPDLASLRTDPEFKTIAEEIEDRIRIRRQLSDSVFPWQG